MARQRQDETPADFCRRMGWGVGTRLVGVVMIGDTTVTFNKLITAIGKRCVLAETPYRCEYITDFSDKDWEVAP
jgi:hypothetical protein